MQRRAHSRALRRQILETRTVTLSLRVALDDLRRDEDVPFAQRIALQRAWCQRASVLLDNAARRHASILDRSSPVATDSDAELRSELDDIIGDARSEFDRLRRGVA